MDAKAKVEDNGMGELAERLKAVPENSRKLLARIVELAYFEPTNVELTNQGKVKGRQENTVYLPELHESCGLDVEAMYEALKPLQSAGLLAVENEYPFEDVELLARRPSGENMLAELARLCEQANVSVWDVIVGLRWDALQ